MEKNSSFPRPLLSPRKATVDFLLCFSKSMVLVKTQQLRFIISKN